MELAFANFCSRWFIPFYPWSVNGYRPDSYFFWLSDLQTKFCAKGEKYKTLFSPPTTPAHLYKQKMPVFINPKIVQFVALDSLVWFRLHQAPFPPNVKDFIFRLLHTSLPLQSRVRRGSDTQMQCFWCSHTQQELESHSHFLGRCHLMVLALTWASKMSYQRQELVQILMSASAWWGGERMETDFTTACGVQ